LGFFVNENARKNAKLHRDKIIEKKAHTHRERKGGKFN